MEHKDKKEIYEKLSQILNNIKETDDNIININKKLKIVLINLKVESAHIKECNGVMPIAIELERLINTIDDSVNNLIHNNRGKSDELLEALRREIE